MLRILCALVIVSMAGFSAAVISSERLNHRETRSLANAYSAQLYGKWPTPSNITYFFESGFPDDAKASVRSAFTAVASQIGGGSCVVFNSRITTPVCRDSCTNATTMVEPSLHYHNAPPTSDFLLIPIPNTLSNPIRTKIYVSIFSKQPKQIATRCFSQTPSWQPAQQTLKFLITSAGHKLHRFRLFEGDPTPLEDTPAAPDAHDGIAAADLPFETASINW